MSAESDQTARVAAICVTWNRRDAVVRAIGALAAQDAGPERIDVVVVDNASTDGTGDTLAGRWLPEAMIEQRSGDGASPEFHAAAARERPAGGAAHPFGSFTIIRNAQNLGGCGGFNTGLAFVRDRLAVGSQPPDFVWLLDDDAVVAPDALGQLIRAMEVDPRIAVAGSRMLRPRAPEEDDHDPHAAARTTETTVYLDPQTGLYTPTPGKGHPLANAYAAWRSLPEAERLVRPVDVDVTAACSLLARWSAVEKVGLWDPRFFISGDDADWCLRMRRAGYRVVCAPGATVEHELWKSKRDAGRDYCRRRNLVWVWSRWFEPSAARRVTRAHFRKLLAEARRHAAHRRAFEARATLRTVLDAATGRGGRLDLEPPRPVPIREALRDAGGLGAPDRVVIAAGSGRARKRGELLRRLAARKLGQEPRGWRRIDDGLGRRGRLMGALGRPPRVVIVPTHACTPIVRRGSRTVRIASLGPPRVTVERGGWRWRARFEARYWRTRFAAWWSLRRLPEAPEPPPGVASGPARDGVIDGEGGRSARRDRARSEG